MKVKISDIHKHIELKVLRTGDEDEIIGFSLLAKETASSEIKEFCRDLSDKIHSSKLALAVSEKKTILYLYKPKHSATATVKFLLADQTEAAILGRIINNYPTIEVADNQKIEAIKGQEPSRDCCGLLVIGAPKKKI